MEIKRTANAGVLLKLDGLSILLDGVCKAVHPYQGTPDVIREELTAYPPDILAFTHRHEDHYDDAYAKAYETTTLRSVIGPEGFSQKKAGSVKLQAIPTRHIGRVDLPHVSFVITGSQSIWFMGDASPLVWKSITGLPMPDVVIAPYAYANTESAWQITKGLGAKNVVIVHLPERKNDTYRLWEAVEKTTQGDLSLHIPEIGQNIVLY